MLLQLVCKISLHTYHRIAFLHINHDVFGTRRKSHKNQKRQYLIQSFHSTQYLKLYEMEGTAENRYIFFVSMLPFLPCSNVMAQVL